MTIAINKENLSAFSRELLLKSSQIIFSLPTLLLFISLLLVNHSLPAQAENKLLSNDTPLQKGKQHQITIVGFKFQPSELFVSKGDTIIWTNKDIAPHSIMLPNSNKLISPVLQSEQSFTLKVDSGFNYICGIHPSMKGKIRLKKPLKNLPEVKTDD